MRNPRGYVLVAVMLVLAVTTALIGDFIRTVYVYAETAGNFGESERLAMLLRSAYVLASERARELSSRVSYTQYREIPFEEKADDAAVRVVLIDNNSRFNVNSLVYKNGLVNENAYNAFRRLLRELALDEGYADTLVDWIDPDRSARSKSGEAAAKNYFLFSLSELRYIFSGEDYVKIAPYLTVHGDGLINLNTAELPVLRALHGEINEATAKRIVETRTERAFENKGSVLKVSGMERIGIEISDMTTVKSSAYIVSMTGQRGDYVTTVDALFDLTGGRVATRYWREQ